MYVVESTPEPTLDYTGPRLPMTNSQNWVLSDYSGNLAMLLFPICRMCLHD